MLFVSSMIRARSGPEKASKRERRFTVKYDLVKVVMVCSVECQSESVRTCHKFVVVELV